MSMLSDVFAQQNLATLVLRTIDLGILTCILQMRSQELSLAYIYASCRTVSTFYYQLIYQLLKLAEASYTR